MYFGWWVVAASFVCLMLVNGSTIFLFGLMVVPVSEDLQLPRSVANQGYILYMAGLTVWGPVAGWLIDRLSVRLLVPAGAVMIMAGFLAIATTDRLWMIALMLAFPVAFGAGLAGMITGSALTSRWFRRRRGRALGIYAMASSLAGLAITPASAAAIEALGWRSALIAQGFVLCVLIVTFGLVLMRDQPSAEQLRVEIDPNESGTEKPLEGRVWTAKDLLRERNFYLIVIAMGIVFASDGVLVVSMVPHMSDQGISLTAAALVVSAQSASATFGKFVVGFLSERISIIRIYGVVVACHLLLLALYLTWPGYWIMVMASAVIGIAVGGVVPVKFIMLSKAFGSRSFAYIMGLATVISQIFSAIALYLAGVSYDRAGNYSVAFIAMMLAVTISFLLASQARFDQAPQTSPTKQ
ncbi:MAG: MFS transporter [Novosphingobium sp.]|nr:MFS transporter [Novosphingobium sp.]